MIRLCKVKCRNEGQDKLHGPGMRVMNEVVKNGKVVEYRCTVCKTVHYPAVAA